MINFKDKVALVYDYGNFIYVAQKLAESFGKVYYVCPWQTSFPTQNTQMPGIGVPNLIKMDELESVEDEVDLFYFTDLFRPALQQRLKDKGKLVFGSGWGGNMEVRRIDFLEFMENVGLPTPKYEVIEGLGNLEKNLEDKQDKWIKVEGFFRGDLETYHYKKKELSKTLFNDMRHSLGVAQYHQLFVVCDPIDNAVEIGSDLMTVDGKYPKMGSWGIEIKDAGFAAIWDKYTNFPKQLLNVNNKLEQELDKLEYRGCISTEVRIQKGKPGILGDITCRNPEPPTSIMIEMIENYGECVWKVASGEIPEPVSKNKYGVMIVIKSDMARTEPVPIYFPDEIERWVKIKNLCVVDGIKYYVPQNVEMREIGAVIGLGNTLEDAILECQSNAKKVEGPDLEMNEDTLNKAFEQINKFKEYSITGWK